MEEQLEALSEKLARLAEQERKVSRRMACRSPERGTVLNDPKAKRRNASVEDFCHHWMAWIRGGSLHSETVAACREKFLESVESMLPAWGELTSREMTMALADAKSQLEVVRERRKEAMQHLTRSRELSAELRQVQVEIQQQHQQLPSLYLAAQGALIPEAPASKAEATQAVPLDGPVHQEPVSNNSRPRETPVEAESPVAERQQPQVEERSSELPVKGAPVLERVSSPEEKPVAERAESQASAPANRPVVCQVSTAQEVLMQVKNLLSPWRTTCSTVVPGELRKLLRSPEPWYPELIRKASDLSAFENSGPKLQLLAAALLLLKGHMSKNPTEAFAAASGARPGRAMAWEELFLLLPKLAALCSQADLEALCKIFAEQLLPGARVEPVRRLKQALLQAAIPLPASPVSSPASVEAPVKQEPTASMALAMRPKAVRSLAGDLSRRIRSDPAWRLAAARDDSEEELAEVDDL